MNDPILGRNEAAASIWLALARFEGNAAMSDVQDQRATICYSYKSRPSNGAKGYADGKRFEVLSSSRSELTQMIMIEVQFVAD